ncbi:MAG TPA: hypothetical protein VGQ02_07650 [Candidatus Limnocylindrales bacterium]|jgi:hypothetical protein|nr:hypothetical protein [Candidatus Limnocylindrales bacterium]
MRVVASPEAIDRAVWHDEGPEEFEPLVVRLAPDDAFAIGATGVEVDDQHAIVEHEVGFIALMFPADEFVDVVVPRLEWPAPMERPAFAQGAIAGVPAKLYLDSTGAAIVLVLASYLDDLLARLPVQA